MTIRLLITTLLFPLLGLLQTVTNGDFQLGNVSWGCSPEIQGVSVYGGTGSDIVAEVDLLAGLCQTISGFTVGSFYTLTFDCSYRTTCGPVTQTIDVSIDNGALPAQSVSRTGPFGFTQETFGFGRLNNTYNYFCGNN